MRNILEFKNKIRQFQEGVDYTIKKDERDEIYTVRSRVLKDFFWGDTSDGSEYRVVIDRGGNVVSSERNVVVDSPESVAKESRRRNDLETFSKSSASSFSYSQKDDNPQNHDDSEDNESDDENRGEKFFYGLRQEIAPGETTGKIEKTVYHRRKKGKNYVEDKIVIDSFNSEESETNDSSRFQEITDDVEMTDAKRLEEDKSKKAKKSRNLEEVSKSVEKGNNSVKNRGSAIPFVIAGVVGFLGLIGFAVAK